MSISIIPGIMELVMMFSGIGLPLGIPPASEDPVVSSVAPEECLFYLSWAGVAQPDPTSHNHTEQLLAENEVQECLAQLEERIMEIARRGLQDDPQAAAMVEPVATMARAVLTHPTAVFVSKFNPADSEHGIRGGALVNLGEQAIEIEQALAKIEKALMEGDANPLAKSAKWHRFPLGTEGFAAEWAIKGKYMILGVGDGEADKIMERARQKPPAWLAEVRKQLAIPRPASMIYVNVAEIIQAMGSQIPPDGRAILEALGLTQIQSVVTRTGLDDTGYISKTQITVDGDLTGLLSVFTSEPLGKDHLAVIPKDATVAAAARLDLAKAYQELLDAVGRVEPRARDELLGGVGQFEERIKIKLSQDIFESLGDVWRVYNSPTEGGLVVTGLTAVVNLRDHDRLVAANGKLVMSALFGGAAQQVIGRGRGQPVLQISQFKFGEHTIFFLKSAGIPFAPAWCITEQEFVLALFPQNIKAYLSRTDAASSLIDVPAAAGLFASEKAPLAVAYCNTPELFKMAYPIVQIITQFALGQFQRSGMNIDISILPSAPTIGRHLQPTVISIQRTKAGVVIETRQTLPVGAGVGGLTLFGRLASPRGFRQGSLPTMQNVSINNLKQITLALHNHHVAMRTFPAAAGPRRPGQPPVSWRVLILPYLEEGSLYNQYRFEEPWDSENNMKIAAQMPAVFKAPGSKAAAQGRTNYLAVVGDECVFAADKGRSIAEIHDGTSNTIMVVEVNDEKAVPWTKPDDFTPDKTNPIAGLVGLRPGGFLAAFADGSVRRISTGIDAATLRALFTRAGGEAVTE
ncbi:MAG: DUF1559 domain-containing protein [Pirellulales bacterium]|nr:DUF1559 domain-containing protein [Pirellulales bacterium]